MILPRHVKNLPGGQNSKKPRVLTPGSGLSRLPFECARRGYAAQGNEFSYHMLQGCKWVLGRCISLLLFFSLSSHSNNRTIQYLYWNEPGGDKFERSKSAHRLLDWWSRFWWCPTFARSNPIFDQSPCFQCLFLAPHYWYYCLCRWSTFCSQVGRDWGAEWDRSRTKPHHLPLRSYIWISRAGLGSC